MKFNRLRKAGIILLTVMTFTLGSSFTAFAQASPPEEDTVTSEGITLENPNNEETKEQSETQNEEVNEEIEDTDGILTPEGNLTLVDDLDESESEELQYMTVTTGDGSYFYIIVDRSGSEQNVYFLNAVDAADLLSIMSDEEQEQYADILKADEEEETPILIEDDTETDAEISDEDSGKSSMNSGLFTLIVFAVLGALVAVGYYLIKIKPGKNHPNEDDDLEFYDDEEYEEDDYGCETEDVTKDTMEEAIKASTDTAEETENGD